MLTLKRNIPYLFLIYLIRLCWPMPEISLYNSNVTTKLYDSLYQKNGFKG